MKKLISLLLVLVMALCAAEALAEDVKDGNITYTDENGRYVEEFWNQGTLQERYVSYEKENGESVYEYWDGNGLLGYNVYTADGREISYDAEGNMNSYTIFNATDHSSSWTSYDVNDRVIAEGEDEYTENSNKGKSIYYGENGEKTIVTVYESSENNHVDVIFDEDGNLLNGWIDDLHYEPENGKWVSNESGEETKAPDVSEYLEKAMAYLKSKKAAPAQEPTWYANNTVGVIGISLRDEYPNLTQKWYNVLPVDVSKDGTQTFQLVASNKYYLGNVKVTVSGDEVTTTYAYPYMTDYELYPQDECLAWFTGVEEITSAFLENPTSEMKFGTAISREKDLNGQETALLFICNHVTYRVPFNDAGAAPIRFWRNHLRMADYFAGAKTMLEKVETEYAQKKAEAEAAAQAEAEAAAKAEEEAAAAAAEAETVEEAVEEAAEAVEEAAEEAVKEAEETAEEAAETAEKAAEEAAETVKENAEEAVETAEKAAEEAAETVKEVAKEAAETVEKAVEKAAEEAAETEKTEAETK